MVLRSSSKQCFACWRDSLGGEPCLRGPQAVCSMCTPKWARALLEIKEMHPNLPNPSCMHTSCTARAEILPSYYVKTERYSLCRSTMYHQSLLTWLRVFLKSSERVELNVEQYSVFFSESSMLNEEGERREETSTLTYKHFQHHTFVYSYMYIRVVLGRVLEVSYYRIHRKARGN